MCGGAWKVSLRHVYCLVADSQHEALVAQARVKPTPSDFVKNQAWKRYQQRDDAILCLRPGDRRGWPIPLLHKSFCDFTRHFLEPNLNTNTTKYLVMAGKLCDSMPSAFDSQVHRRDAFEAIFHSLDQSLMRHDEYHLSASPSDSTVKQSGGRPNVVRPIPWKGAGLVLLLEEFKNEVGDSYMQICRSYEVLCEDPKAEQLVKFGNPMFLLCVQGMYQTFIRITLAELGYRPIPYGLRRDQTRACPSGTPHAVDSDVPWVWCRRPPSPTRILPPSAEGRIGFPPKFLVNSQPHPKSILI
jgi:hypothetical protein